MDSQKLEEYISKKKGQKKKLIQWLANHIQFIDRTQFNSNMDKSVSDMISSLSGKSGDIYLWLSMVSKFGSEHWLTLKYSEEISQKLGKEVNFVYFEEQLPTEGNVNLIILDDAMYSGTNLTSQIYRLLETSGNADLEIFLVVPFYTNFGIDSVTRAFNDVGNGASFHFFGSSRMKTVSEYAEEEDFRINWKIFNKMFYPDLTIGNEVETYNPTTTWFRHKIANNFGTLTKLIQNYSLIKTTREEINEEYEKLPNLFKLGFKIGTKIQHSEKEEVYREAISEAISKGDESILIGIMSELGLK